VKGKIAAKLGLKADEFDIAFGGKTLPNDQPIENHNVQKSCTVMMIARLRGGV
jgi:hypothetical protein